MSFIIKSPNENVFYRGQLESGVCLWGFGSEKAIKCSSREEAQEVVDYLECGDLEIIEVEA